MARADRREAILDAALKVFAQRGYHEASMDELALASRVSKAVLYDHFASKQALYIAVLQAQVAALSARVLPHLDPAQGTLEDRVREGALAALQFARERPRAWRLLFQEPVGERAITQAFAAMRDRATSAVAASIADDAFVPPAGVEREFASRTLAALIMALTERLGDLALASPEHSPEQLVALYLDLVWIGIERLASGERWRRTRSAPAGRRKTRRDRARASVG
jgi:AcrR family transcriptional regulator